LVDAFLLALNAPVITKPQMENLGITSQWLTKSLSLAEKSMPGSLSDATPSQKSLFASSFVNPALMANVVSDLFAYSSFDDNPYASAEVTFDDGSRLTAKTHSYYVFMIPWTVSGKGETFNADRKLSDFPAGECDEYYRVNNGGCSGREITPSGELVPESRTTRRGLRGSVSKN
jgi:hypothetical protein